MKFKNQFVRGSILAIALAGASAANAAIDTTALVSEISGNTAAVAAIGGAVLLVIVTASAFRWVRRAL